MKDLKDAIDQGFYRQIGTALRELDRFFLTTNSTNKAIFDNLEAFFMPSQGNQFGQLGEQNFSIIDPMPENSLERAVSGYLSFHSNPYDSYFRLHRIQVPGKGDLTDDVKKALGERSREVHAVIQEPSNFQVVGQNVRDKFIFGVCCKVVEPDPVRTAKLSYIPAKDVAIGSSNGQELDIYGTRENLTYFQARRRFPEPLDKEYWEMKLPDGVSGASTMMYYRFNMPVEVLRHHLMDKFREDETAEKIFKKLLPEGKKSGPPKWAEVWFDDETVMSIEVFDYRRIVTSFMSPPYSVNSFPRGQGEKAMPLVLSLLSITATGLKGFERTYDPPWQVTDEMERLGMDMRPDGIVFKEQGMDDAKPLSLNANMQDLIAFHQYKQSELNRLFYLDTFELINKSRMSRQEVDKRSMDDLKKLASYLVEDHHSDLNPTVLTINYLIHEQLKGSDPLNGEVLNAHYISPLASAARGALMNKFREITALGKEVGEVVVSDAPINDLIDLEGYYSDVVIKMGSDEYVRDDTERKERIEQRKAIARNRVNEQKGRALAASSDAIQRSIPQGAGEPGQVQGQSAQVPRGPAEGSPNAGG